MTGIARVLEKWKLRRNSDGNLEFRPNAAPMKDRSGFKALYCDSLLSYLNILDDAYCRALNISEFELVSSLIRIRGMEGPGWDPFESTKLTVRSVRLATLSINSFEAERTLQLWLYGHIVEASEHYEILMNLARIVRGERYNSHCFPPKKGGRPQGLGEKITQIEKAAQEAGLSNLALPLQQIWDRVLRNAIFHSDFALHGWEITLRNPRRVFSHDQVMTYLNRALAFHDAVVCMDSIYRAVFDKPRVIDVHPEFAKWPGEKAWVIVREGYGAIGLRDALTPVEIAEGKIPWSWGRFLKSELDQMIQEKHIVWFPKRHVKRSRKANYGVRKPRIGK
jgi:hypothetical protein